MEQVLISPIAAGAALLIVYVIAMYFNSRIPDGGEPPQRPVRPRGAPDRRGAIQPGTGSRMQRRLRLVETVQHGQPGGQAVHTQGAGESEHHGFKESDRAWLAMGLIAAFLTFGYWIGYIGSPEATALRAFYRGEPAIEMVKTCRERPRDELSACLRNGIAEREQEHEADKLLRLLKQR